VVRSKAYLAIKVYRMGNADLKNRINNHKLVLRQNWNDISIQGTVNTCTLQGRKLLRSQYDFTSYLKLVLWHYGKKTDWGCLRTGCWGENLELGGRRKQTAEEDCIMRSFIICTLYQMLLAWSIQGEWDGRTCSIHGKMRNVYSNLVRKPEGQRPLGWPRRRWEDNLRVDLREREWEVKFWGFHGGDVSRRGLLGCDAV